MRFIVDVEQTPEGRVCGVLSRPGWRAPVDFSGWLELLRLLGAELVTAGGRRPGR